MLSAFWNLDPGAWNLDHGVWNLDPGAWNLDPGKNAENILPRAPAAPMETQSRAGCAHEDPGPGNPFIYIDMCIYISATVPLWH